MGENTFKIGNRNFSMKKIDALKQFHIVRRISPLLSDLFAVMGSIGKVKTDEMTENEKFEAFGKIATPIMMGLSKLPDADAEFVLFRLLASVQVEQVQFKIWAAIATEGGIMMQDIELPVLLQVAGRALMFNLSGFFALLPR